MGDCYGVFDLEHMGASNVEVLGLREPAMQDRPALVEDCGTARTQHREHRLRDGGGLFWSERPFHQGRLRLVEDVGIRNRLLNGSRKSTLDHRFPPWTEHPLRE